MAPVNGLSVENFLESVRNSSVAAEEDIRLALSDVDSDSAGDVAQALTDRGILNPWQARYLLAGHADLRFGNYVLVDRRGQDSLGERFLATQSSLHRMVDLQILPESVTGDLAVVEKFLASASQLTHLDHPSILHLYDVAENRGRFFIVSESCQPLSAEQFRALPDAGMAHLRAARDLCDAIRYLHDQDLTHGFLGAQSSILFADPGILKIDQLAWSVLQRELVSRSLIDTFEKRRNTDWSDAGKFLSALLSAAVPDESLSATNRDSLAKAFGGLGSATDPAARAGLLAGKINELLDRLEKRPVSAERPAPVPDAADLPHNAKPAAEKAASAAGTGGRVTGANQKSRQLPTRQLAPTKTAASKEPRGRKPVATGRGRGRSRTLIVASAVSLLALASIGGWMAWGKYFGTGDKAVASSNSDRKSARESGNAPSRRSRDKNEPSGVDSPNTDLSAEPADSVSDSTSAQGQNGRVVGTPAAGASSTNGTAAGDDSNPLANPLIVDPLATTPVQAATGKVDAAGLPGMEVPGSVSPDSADSGIFGEQLKPAGQAAAGDATALPDTSALPDATGDQGNGETGTGENPGGGSSTAATTTETEPVGLPTAFALVDSGTNEPQRMGLLPDLIRRADTRFDLNFDPESVGRGKNFSVIKPRGEQWQISWSRKSDSEELEPVATLSINDQRELFFQWADSVDAKHPANCIVNSILTVRAGGRVFPVTLRETEVFEGLALTAESLSAEIKLDLGWLPKDDNIRIELGELAAGLGWTDSAIAENEFFENRQPARIFFRTVPAEQLFWLTIAAKAGAKIEFDLSVQAPVNGQVVALKPADVETGVQLFENSVRQSQALIQQCEQLLIDPPYGTKGKREDALRDAKKQLKAAMAANENALAHQAWLKGLLNSPVPVRVIYPVGEQSIELARSSGWFASEPQPDTTEKE